MDIDSIRAFRKRLRRFERLIGKQQKGCCGSRITLAQCHVLLEIEAQAETTLMELTQRLELDKSTLSRTIEGLVHSGLVERAANPSDRRFTRLLLTPEGKGAADRLNRENDGFFGKMLETIPEEIRSDVLDRFGILVDALAQTGQPPGPCVSGGSEGR